MLTSHVMAELALGWFFLYSARARNRWVRSWRRRRRHERSGKQECSSDIRRRLRVRHGPVMSLLGLCPKRGSCCKANQTPGARAALGGPSQSVDEYAPNATPERKAMAKR